MKTLLAAILTALPLLTPASVIAQPLEPASKSYLGDVIKKECNSRASFIWAIAKSRDSGYTFAKTNEDISEGFREPHVKAWARDYAFLIYMDPKTRRMTPDAIAREAFKACKSYYDETTR